MWFLAFISIIVCITLWYYQIKNNIEKKKRRRREKVIHKLEKYAEQSEYGTVYEKIIELYESSDSTEIEEIIKNSILPRYEKIAVISSMNKILKTGIDEKTGFHKKTLVFGKVIGFTMSICVSFVFLILKDGTLNFLELIMVYSGSHVIFTIFSYIIIESVILKRFPWSKQGNENEEKSVKEKNTLFDKVYDVLDNIFGQY